jgi:hypothetical protein
VAGWLVGLTIVSVIELAVAGPSDPTDGAEPATLVGVLKLEFWHVYGQSGRHHRASDRLARCQMGALV